MNIQNTPQSPSLPQGWGQVKSRIELGLPSGAKVLVEKIEVTDLLSLGLLDSLDTFTQKLIPSAEDKDKAAQSGKTEEEIFGERVLNDIEQFADVIKVVDKVVSRSVVEPRVLLADGDAPLDPSRVYAHLIPLEDRMAIFEAVLPDMTDTFPPGGGSSDGVATVENVEAVWGSPS